MKEILNFINGQYAEPHANTRWLDVFCPGTGEVYAKCVDSSADDVNAAVAAAKAAFRGWSKTPVETRAALLNKIADIIERRLEEFAQAESHDQGKSIHVARTVEIPRAVANFRFYAGRILHHEEKAMVLETSPVGPALSYTTRSPIGVAGLISPWNMPLYLATWKIAPAIALGNTCVLKPSEITPMTAFMLGEVCREAGIPPGVVNIVQGRGPSAGQPLIEHKDVALISFTGGTITGKNIARTAAPMLKKLSLELGGKNATIVFKDADMDECITGTVRAAFANQGEVCLCGSRILVERAIYDEFVQKFVAAVNELKIGDPSDPSTFCGAVVSKEHKEKILSYIKLAEQEGGKIECGGAETPAGLPEKCKNGYFVRPTVVTGLRHHDRCNMEEVFGPFVTIAPFDTEAQAIDVTNSVEYGLSASVWTTDIRRAQRVAHHIEVAYVWINCWLVRDLRAPFGGMKASGIGREGGDYSVDFYSEVKTTCTKYY